MGVHGALAVVTFAVSFVFSYRPSELQMSLPAAVAISAAAAGAVWLTGRRPIAALAVVVTLAVGLPLVNGTFQPIDIVVVLVTFQVAIKTTMRPWLLAGICFVTLTFNDAWQRTVFEESFMKPSVLYPLLLSAVAVGLGLQSRRVWLQHRELASAHEQLLALSEADRKLAVSDERRRIARDLHDVAAHHLSALVVRNKLAQRVDTDEALRDAAQFTAETAADTLDALRQVVHVLSTDSASPLAPSPSLADLDAMTTRMQAAGLQIQRSHLINTPIGRDTEVAAVRIAQEALANVLRHRGPGPCWLDIKADTESVVVTVEDDGPSILPPEMALRSWHRQGSHGLIGMRERAEACGGHLRLGPSPRGGWKVSAVLPTYRP